MSQKTILEQALLQVQTLEEVVKANAKGILASTMKKELKEMLKEATEEEVDEQPKSEEDETSDEDENDESPNGTEPETTDDSEVADVPSETDMENDETDVDGFDEPDTEDTDSFMDDDTLDMTNASDDEVIKVYKSLKPEDGVIVKKSGDDINFQDGNDEYIIRLDDENGLEDGDVDSDIDEDWDYDSPDGNAGDDENDYDNLDRKHQEDEDDAMDNQEDTYEIDLGDESDEEQVEEVTKEEDVEESARTIKNGYHGGLKSKNVYKAGNKREEMNEEIKKLKEQNGEYRKALILFKDKLNEVAIFNANLAYSTRLFTEHSTTKQEKIEILKRFDGIDSLNESKKLYGTIKNELGVKKPMVESVLNKIKNNPTTSSSTEVLTESKAYENPEFKRIKDLMAKIR